MGKLPSLEPLFYLAIFGLLCGAVLGGWLLWWAAYHFARMLMLYNGWSL